MKRVILLLILVAPITGCQWMATTFGDNPSAATETAIVHSFTTACSAYAQTLNAASVARAGHLLSDAAVAKIDAVRPGANGLCLGPMPTNVAGSAVIVVTATATIVAALAAK
jgi:hypothetical protein